MMTRSETRSRRERPRGDEEGTVIVLGWQVIVLPLLAVAVVAAGFLVGRAISGQGKVPAAAPGGPVAEVSDPPGVAGAAELALGTPGVPIDQSGQNGSQLPGLIPEGQVIDFPSPNHPLLGQEAPDFTVPVLDGAEQVSLSDLAGSPVVVNFWATWCPPCRYEMPFLQSVHEAYEDRGLVVLAMNAGEGYDVTHDDAVARVRAFGEVMGLTFPLLMPDLATSLQVQRQYMVSGLPATFFVGPDGRVASWHKGVFPNEASLLAKVAELIGDPTPTSVP